MKIDFRWASPSVLFMLAACGGGDGSSVVQSTPAPPANTTLSNLQYSQSFVNDASTTKAAFDLTTSNTLSGTAGASNLTVSYDAASHGYTVTVAGNSQTFGTADIQSGSTQYLTSYRKSGAGGADYLQIITPGVGTGNSLLRYVGLGTWQHNQVSGSIQSTDFATFTYGLPTAASAVPRTGSAGYSIYAFGLATAPGSQPRAFEGTGGFSVDFGAGVFSTQTYLTETELVSKAGTTGGNIQLIGAGHLSSSDGSFSGNALYSGWNGEAAGTMNGRFYGPNGQELGASFSAGNAAGMAVTGAFAGQSNATIKPDNQTLTNLTQPQLFYTQFGNNLVGQLNWQSADTFTFATPTSDLTGGQFTAADKVAGDNPNFITYRKTFTNSYNGSQDVTLQLFRPGSGNSELALTYASFGSWTVISAPGKAPVPLYFTYGMETPARLLSGKTGSGHYDGLVYGSSYTAAEGYLPVKGTSTFDVNFSNQSYSGSLAMKGTANGAPIDFGSFDFAGKLAAYLPGTDVGITRGGQSVGQMQTRFYGPDGEEIAGKFSLGVPTGSTGAGTSISGVAVARRQ